MLSKKRLANSRTKPASNFMHLDHHQIELIWQKFREGSRLAYVYELEQLASQDKVVLKRCFSQIGQAKNYSRFAHFKRHGVPDSDNLLSEILKLSDVPKIEPSDRMMFHWGCRLAVVQVHHRFFLGEKNKANCRPPLSIQELFYLQLAHDILSKNRDSSNKLTIETIHQQIPHTVFELLPWGEDVGWFKQLVNQFLEPLAMVLSVVSNDERQERGATA